MPKAQISNDDPRMMSYKARRAATLEARKIYAEVLAGWLPSERSPAQTLEICEYIVNLMPVQDLLEFYEGRAPAEEVLNAAKAHDPLHYGHAVTALRTPTLSSGLSADQVREVLRERRAPAVSVRNLDNESEVNHEHS